MHHCLCRVPTVREVGENGKKLKVREKSGNFELSQLGAILVLYNPALLVNKINQPKIALFLLVCFAPKSSKPVLTKSIRSEQTMS